MTTLSSCNPFCPLRQKMAAILGTIGPRDLDEQRMAAWSRFEAAGIPTVRDEEFKYLPLKELDTLSLSNAYGSTVSHGDLSTHPLASLDVPTLTLVNGEYAPELSNLTGLPKGCLVMSLSEALEDHSSLVMQTLGQVATLKGKLGSTNDERFVDLNTAFLAEGAFIRINKGVIVEPAIHIQHVSRADHGAFAQHPRVVISLEEGAQAKIIESFWSLSQDGYVCNPVTEMEVGARAQLEHIRYQDENPSVTHIGAIYANQGHDSTLTLNSASFGGKVARCDANVWVGGEHAETWINGAYLARDGQLIDNHTRLDHAVPNCHSFEVFKGILGNDATGVFNGKIFVYEDAQKTDAKQTNQALLLSPTAQVNTKPQLEIFADDVKCTHGATVGQLREDALFYLRSRGVPEKEARGLLVYAFAAEVLEKISIEPVRKAVEGVLLQRLQVG